jgi:hypothetical protein
MMTSTRMELPVFVFSVSVVVVVMTSQVVGVHDILKVEVSTGLVQSCIGRHMPLCKRLSDRHDDAIDFISFIYF